MAGEDIFGSMISAGLGMATGNPLAIAGGIAGLGMSIMGGMDSTSAASQKAQAQKKIADLETQQDAVRKQAMEISARRQQMEVLRNQQRARSLALNSATSQGAQMGSGLQGGYGQVAGQSGVNLLGISQGLQSGEQMFGLNAQINSQKMNIADSDSLSAKGAGLSKLGGSLMGSFGPIKNLSGNFGGGTGSSASSTMGGWTSSMGGGLI